VWSAAALKVDSLTTVPRKNPPRGNGKKKAGKVAPTVGGSVNPEGLTAAEHHNAS
jgi:hypothetical protein